MEQQQLKNTISSDFEHFIDDIYFGKYLKFKKYYDDTTFLQLRNVQELSNKKLGQLAVDKKYLPANIVDSLYDEGIRENKYFGQLALEKHLLTPEQIMEIINEQRSNFISVGDLALNFGYIRPDKLQEEKTLFTENQKKIELNIEEKIRQIQFPHLRLILDTIIITLTRMLYMPPRLTNIIQPVTSIFNMDKLYKLGITKHYNFDIYFNYDEKFVNELFIYKFRVYKSKRMLKLRNSIPQEISNILTGVIAKNLAEASNAEVGMTVPYVINESKIDLPVEHYKFSLTSPTGKMEVIIDTSKNGGQK